MKASPGALAICIAFCACLGAALLKVGRFERPNIEQLRQEAGVLILALQKHHASSNTFPQHLSELSHSMISTSVVDVWNDWIYQRRSSEEAEMYKYTGHLQDTIQCRIGFVTNFTETWTLDDDSGAEPRPLNV